MAAFHHLAIHVRDLPSMAAFYGELFELPVLERWPDAAGGERSVWLELQPGFLALERSAGAPERGEPFETEKSGLLLLAVRIERSERERWEARLAERGIPVERRTAFSLFFRDPEGNRLAVSHHPDGAAEAT